MKPIAKFVRLAPSAPPIRPADSTLGGSLPLRAAQHCDPVVTACGYGWHIMAPTEFGLLFDGRGFLITFDEGAVWHPLADCQIPGLELEHQQCQRHRVAKLLPPFASSLAESGVVQIWSGYSARTRRGWALSIGGVVNHFPSSVYDCMEGVVETDWWTGPLFTNLVFRQSNRPVFFSRERPLFQVRPILKAAYSRQVRDSMEQLLDIGSVEAHDLSDYEWSATRDGTLSSQKGWYAKRARQGRR